MSSGAILIWWLSGVFLSAVLVYEFMRARGQTPELVAGSRVIRRHRLATGLAVAGLLIVLVAVALDRGPSGIQSKGGIAPTQWAMIGAMYAAMVVGIVAQSFYFSDSTLLSSIASWVKPVLASPIIFIPLLSSYHSSLDSLSGVGMAELMILLVSFQNGFFWKVVFDKQAEVIGKSAGRA